ncbi:sigma-54 dependent transcriptional regulator [Photobacterium sagamiensis]|uniref:sigma-54 dependent transcriptional regulator n=1 Tax=Photobacterium sagamiensis TaxID=2910241 RepID=UPI003D125480
MSKSDVNKQPVRQCALWEGNKMQPEDRQIIRALETAGWVFVSAEDIYQHDQVNVGLVCLSDDCTLAELIPKLTTINPHVYWVALASKGFFEQPEHRGLLRFLFDFHTRPAQLEWLNNALGHASGVSHLQHSAPSQPSSIQFNRSAAMQDILQQAEKIAITDASVLLLGPSGAGKQYLSQFIHQHSLRSKKPFITVNCAGLVPTLVQDELFGHEKGAFTGASQTHRGAFERANGGTLLLDEIGDLPLEQQGNFLHVLESGEICRVGGQRSHSINVRIISATNVDLAEKVEQGLFRADLYYRLNVIQLSVPPLSERPEDILSLANDFMGKYSANCKPPLRFSPRAAQALNHYHWPGNVRELANRVMRAVTLCDGSVIEPEHLDLPQSTPHHQKSLSLKHAREEIERQEITKAISRHNGNISRAAHDLGISRYTIYRHLKQLNINV